MIQSQKKMIIWLPSLLFMLIFLGSAHGADFKGLAGTELRSFESCVCRCSLGLAPHVGAELSLKKVRTYNPNASCAKLSNGPCIGGGMGCYRGYPKGSCIKKCMKDKGVENHKAAKAHFDAWSRKVRLPKSVTPVADKVIVTATRGGFELSRNGGSTWVAVLPDQSVELTVQDMVRTSNNTRAELSFPDGSVFRIKSNSTLTLVSGGVKLQVGELWFNLRKQGKRFRVVTPTTVCGVLGTSGIVTATPEGVTIVKLVKGKLEVTNQAGKGKVILKAGQLTVVPPCGVPTQPCSFDTGKLTDSVPKLRPAESGGRGASVSSGSAAASPSQSQASASQAMRWYKEGLSAIRAKQYNKAVDLLTKALKARKLGKRKTASAYYQRGWARGRLGQDSHALADVEKAINNNPKVSVYHHMRGWFLMKHKRYQEALKACHTALKQNAKNPFAYHTLSHILERQGDCPGALKAARQAFRMRPKDLNIKKHLEQLTRKGCSRLSRLTIPVTQDRNVVQQKDKDADASNYIIDGNQSKGWVMMAFQVSKLPDSKPLRASLQVTVSGVKDAPSRDGFTVYQGNTVLGRQGSVSANQTVRVALDVSKFKPSKKIVLKLMANGNDGVYIMSKASGLGPVLKLDWPNAAQSAGAPGNQSAKEGPKYTGIWTRSQGGKLIEVIQISRKGPDYKVSYKEGFNKPATSTAEGRVVKGVLVLTSRNLKTGKQRRITMRVAADRMEYASTDLNGSHPWKGRFVRHQGPEPKRAKTQARSSSSAKPVRPAKTGKSPVTGVCYVAEQADSGQVLDIKLGMAMDEVKKRHQVLPYTRDDYRLWKDKNPCLAHYSYGLSSSGVKKNESFFAATFRVDEKQPNKPLWEIQAKIVCGAGIDLSRRLFDWYAQKYGPPLKKVNKMDGMQTLGSLRIPVEYWHIWHLKGKSGQPPLYLEIKRRNSFEYYTVTLKTLQKP